ncbi:alkyl hydroperoxide reductase subunit D [Pedobacter steynii]|uniref:Alkyl hydroperoxide reductase AhpD n=1 Tax=Pedobacter steynii TaxID=430522 RepID=A0A1H0DZ64_9SPHI|nr:carboxymuconolactone decarboxylase family protein [Pedobacter steynii]NQX41876.1 carboxymuconolactone decarboxylase family protein [Pedobacter steynii]SDN75484.1 alkyl hydroperoxide reductase subunit D [Pedobacter steynii]
MSEVTETIQELLAVVGLDADYRNESLILLEKGNSRYVRDLKLNFSSTFTSGHLTDKECALIALSIAVNNNNKVLTDFFEKLAVTKEATAEEVAEAVGCASLLALNNVFYRFRHFTGKEKYTQIPARVRMQIMSSPVTGKEFFELMSIAVSAVNGCEMCVNAHEKSILALGATEERVFDAVRIASIVTSAGKVIY